MERLTQVARAHAELAVACLRLLVLGDTKGWAVMSWREKAREVLQTALASGDAAARRAARDLQNLLGSRGYGDFRRLE